MSRTRQMIELFAPAVLREHRPEQFTVKGFSCPECHGNGWWWKSDGKDYEKTPCRACGGSGEVSAEVTVRWIGEGSSGKTAA